jgi:hypothetical protein
VKYWGVAEDEYLVSAKEDILSIVRQLRFKLITLTTGVDDDFIMRKYFKSIPTQIAVETL